MAGTEPNEGERRRWNDRAWVAAWPKRERLTSAVTDILLDSARLQPGESVLDIGTGGGMAAMAAARLVYPGTVLGADISEPLVELARSRAAQERVGNVSFVVADVQQEALSGAPFDVAISQFGVMFFDEPKVAFANIRAQLRSGARLAFACWRAPGLNPWFPGAALAGIVPPPPSPPPGKSPTHPFSLSDPDTTIAILRASGWSGIECAGHDLVVTVERDAIIDREGLGFAGVPTDALDAAGEAIDRQLAPHTREDGRVDAPLAFQVFTASA